MQYDQKQITIVCGMSGCGKTTFAIRYLLNATLSCRFIFDPDGEYSKRLGLAPAADAYDLGLALCRGWVIFDPSVAFAGRYQDAFAWFAEWTYEVCASIPGRKCLAIDEVWKYCDPWKIPLYLATIVQTGRKRGIGLMVNTQLPHKLNGALLAEVSEMVCFRLQLEKALDLAQERGFDRLEVANLAPFQFVARTFDGAELAGRLRL